MLPTAPDDLIHTPAAPVPGQDSPQAPEPHMHPPICSLHFHSSSSPSTSRLVLCSFSPGQDRARLSPFRATITDLAGLPTAPSGPLSTQPPMPQSRLTATLPRPQQFSPSQGSSLCLLWSYHQTIKTQNWSHSARSNFPGNFPPPNRLKPKPRTRSSVICSPTTSSTVGLIFLHFPLKSFKSKFLALSQTLSAIFKNYALNILSGFLVLQKNYSAQASFPVSVFRLPPLHYFCACTSAPLKRELTNMPLLLDCKLHEGRAYHVSS